MPNFRRYYLPNAVIFITCVTHNRIPFLRDEANFQLFWETLRRIQEIHPFDLLAFVIMPDHFHWLVSLPEETPNFSKIMQSIKWNFTINYKKAHNISSPVTLWQSRFWDHIIRDEHDLQNHIDYIHWNPVKHGFVRYPEEWGQSSFEKWADQGYYPPGWGKAGEPHHITGMILE